MRGKLFKKFLLAYSAFIITSIFVIVFLGERVIFNYLLKEKINTMQNQANAISESITKDTFVPLNTSSCLENSLKIISYYDNSEIWLVKYDGKITFISETNSINMLGSKIEGVNTEGNKPYCIGDFYGYFKDKHVTVNRTVIRNYEPIGYVLIHYPIKDIIMDADKIVEKCLVIFSIIIGASFFLLIFFHEIVNKPIKKLNKAVEEYANGNLKYEVSINNDDELGLMAATLNYMSKKIYETEEYQKRLLGNVSHDFRSPLTSIKGYVGAILDGTIPEEMHEKYLKIVLAEAIRLAELTEELLSLNAVDSGKMLLDISEFDINEVIKETANSFEGRCTKRGIQIKLLFADEVSIVRADKNRIKQVIYNLVDNAIKFSKDYDSITVETDVRKDKLQINIKDMGCGIDSKDIGKIWDRFYKSDTSRGLDKSSSGLGLSIVKEIIQLHGENINVISTKDVGTEFFFSLPYVSTNE